MVVRGFKFFILLSLLVSAIYGADCGPERRQYELGNRHFYGRQYLLAAIQFSQITVSDCDALLVDKAKYAYALAMVELGEMEIAIETLKGLNGSTRENPARLYLSFLDASFAGPLNAHDKQRLALWNTRQDPPEFKKVAEVYETHENEKKKLLKLQQLLELAPSRSPVVAGVASVLLPGLGQAYCGSWQAAGIAFVLNALFLATTVEFARHDMWAATAASGLVFSVTYVGNILNAISAAQTVNKVQGEPFERDLKQELFPEFLP